MAFDLTSKASGIDLVTDSAVAGQLLIQGLASQSSRWLQWLIGCSWDLHDGANLALIEWSPDTDDDVLVGSWYPYSPPVTTAAGDLGHTLQLEDVVEPQAARYRLRWAVGGGSKFSAGAYRTVKA